MLSIGLPLPSLVVVVVVIVVVDFGAIFSGEDVCIANHCSCLLYTSDAADE